MVELDMREARERSQRVTGVGPRVRERSQRFGPGFRMLRMFRIRHLDGGAAEYAEGVPKRKDAAWSDEGQ
jgi:hypothetical protein